MKIFNENINYDIALNFEDADPNTCIFSVICDRMDLVTITQDPINLNEFNILIKPLSEELILVKFTYAITNSSGFSNITDEYITLRRGFFNDVKYYSIS